MSAIFANSEDISIHAPHEGVRQLDLITVNSGGISIHAPHEGVRQRRMESAL